MSLIIFSVCAGVLQFGFLAYHPLMSFTFSERRDHSPTWRLLLFSIIFCQSTACFSDFRPSPHLPISCFYLLPFSFFLSSSLPLLQFISLLHLIPFHYSFRLHHISLFPFPFFLHLSHSCLDRLRDVGQLFPHSVFKSQTATVPHDSSRKPRPGRHWGSGGRVTRGLLALICVKNAVGQIFSRFNVSVCYSEVRGVRQLLVGVFFRKTGATCKY